ncbi:efflux transporter, RND family, MFP subunit [Novosphingobium sp. Rr 2-17]|uniref:efflux RND transporter periplasmic adaptor subunit n=1 Tax=Novosphingobium sp. Rr 2-17 TaxID=555793 RepID=UPI0002698EB0|nr:efflux RND transporter periplasmic adaptor subunit [Novosphingobium sp. Rr 2-17]EIZ80089.1 efflux transporter, RND family, MFP subunit [Novosphingobium sp. Rr 2-17]
MQSEDLPPSAPPRGLKVAGIVAVVAAIGIIAAGAVVRSSETASAGNWTQARMVPTVHLVTVKASGGSDNLTLPGTMAAWNSARLFARVNGYVRSWSQDIGAQVAAGTPLGLVDTPELDQQIVQARAALARARAGAGLAASTAQRWNDLVTDHSVSQQEADEKNGNLAVQHAIVEGAQAELNRLLATKAYATVRAPFSGVVTGRNADIGDLVGPGASNQEPMFTVADVRRIRIYASVPQTYSAAMRPGITASVAAPDYPGRTFVARVVGTSDSIDPKTGTLQVQLVADNAGQVLKPGGYAQITFDVPGQRSAVVVPSSALLFRAAGMQVATVGPDSKIMLHAVSIGQDHGGTVEVTAGIAAGARIVDNPPDSIANGEQVHVQDEHHA